MTNDNQKDLHSFICSIFHTYNNSIFLLILYIYMCVCIYIPPALFSFTTHNISNVIICLHSKINIMSIFMFQETYSVMTHD